MPRAAVCSFLLLMSVLFATSYASSYSGADMFENNLEQANLSFDSGMLKVNTDFFSENDFKRYLIFGTKSQDGNSLRDASIYGVHSDHGFFYVSLLSEKHASSLVASGYHVIEDFRLDFHENGKIAYDASRIGKITGSDTAQKQFGASGNGTVIAIVDTGVDFSNPDMQHSVARDQNNHPVMLDPDGQGIVLTNATFFAHIDKNEIIRNYSKPIPSHMTSSAYVSRDGVFLDVSQGGKGSQIPIYNSFFPQFGSSAIFNGTLNTDMKIGEDNRNFIKSKSGTYHLGVIYQGGLQGPLARVQVVPVLVVDSFTPGIYDTIIPDLSTSWEDYTRYDLENEQPKYDFDFTDEKQIVLGSGNEFLVYDSNGDGKHDYSAGTLGARVLDVYGAISSNHTHIDDSLQAINGTLLPALDPDGEFFGVMTDFMGHGTSSAASIVSRGHETYDVYNDTRKHSIVGVAPDAKILPVKALWFGDTVYGWLWSAGFDNDGSTWKFSGTPRVDIISNSWGVSTFPLFGNSPGMDVLSVTLGMLSVPSSLDSDYPGVTMISSAGNSGHGYGTMGLPNASPFGIAVGATTNNVFVGYGPFKDQPRFGNSTSHYNHVVDFSSRGPSSIGDPKPDVMSVGAHGFTPSSVLKTEKDSREESFSLFGGTSMAAPIVSGISAVIMEGMTKQSKDYDPFLIKNILMSTATDMHNDPFTQGSGLANTKSALDYVHGNKTFIVHNNQSYLNIKEILDPAILEINSTSIGLETFKLPSRPFPMTSWFGGHLLPGERTSATFTIENPSNNTMVVDIVPQTLSLTTTSQFRDSTTVREQDAILNKTGTFIPNYVKLSEINDLTQLDKFFNDKNQIPEKSSLMVLNLNFHFDDFMNNTSDVYADDMKISSLYLYDWLDIDNDTSITSNELSMVNRAGSWGTVQELRVSEPNEKFDGIPVVGVYPVPTRYSYWLGDTAQNSTSMDYTLSASYYHKERWPVIWTESESISVPPGGSSDVDVTLVVPANLQTGAYQGFLAFTSASHSVNAPVSFVVKEPVYENDSVIQIDGVQSNDILYGNGYTKGAFDMVNRYMAGDWRQFYFDVQNESITSAALEVFWDDEDTNLAIFVTDPSGKIIQTNMPSGVFGHFMNWPSIDWLGNSPFSQGGGFFPVKNKDDTSTMLLVPINQTGTYTLLAHSTLFGGNHTTEPISLTAKFLSTSDAPVDEMKPAPSEIRIVAEQVPEDVEHVSSSVDLQNQTLSGVVSEHEKTDMTLLIGLTVGLIVGIAITLLVIAAVRQKYTK